MFEEFQLETIDTRGFITQREGARGVPDISALPTRRKDINTDGNGFDPAQRFVEHLPDGFSAPIGVGLLGDEGTFGGNFMPRYGEISLDMPLICGKNRLTTTTLGDGRRKRVWSFPNGTRDIESVTAWFGDDGRAWLLKYGKMVTWTIENERTGETGGNKSYHFNEAVRNQRLPATVAQNTILSVGATGATGNGVFSVRPAGGVAQNVTFVIGDTVAQTAAKFAAAGLTVAVAGTVAISAGETHTLTANGATGNATIYGAISVAPGEAASSIELKVRALGGNFAGVGVSGATSALGGGQVPAGNPLITNVPTIIDLGSAQTVVQVQAATTGGSNGATTVIKASNDSTFATPTTLGTFGGGGGTFNIPSANQGAYRYLSLATTDPNESYNTANGLFYTTTQTPSVGSYTIAFRVSAGNVADITSAPGNGWTSSVTPIGGAVGSIALTVTAPAQTMISIAKVSGNGWSGAVTQAGSDGSGPVETIGSFIESPHWLVYKAATKAELDAIDMASPGNALVKTATGHMFSLENLSQVVYLEDGKVNPGSHVARRPNATASLTLAVQTDAGMGVDFAESIYASENLGGCGVNPFWLRFRAFCGGNEFWIDGKWARNQQAAHPAQDGLAQWQFQLIRIHDGAGSLFFTLIDAAA